MGALPRSAIGKWGFYCTITFALLFIAAATDVAMPFPSFVIFGIGIAGLILNVIAFVRKDRSITGILVGAMVGAFLVFWVGGELLFPH